MNKNVQNQLSRMKGLMAYGLTTENKNRQFSNVEFDKMAADGKHYAIIREGSKYYIKVSDKKEALREDYNYIGGFCNRSNNEFNSYAKALKQFELKLMSIQENYDKTQGIVIESWDPYKKEELTVESTEKMRKEIARQREIMGNAAKIFEGKNATTTISEEKCCGGSCGVEKDCASTQKNNISKTKPEVGDPKNVKGDPYSKNADSEFSKTQKNNLKGQTKPIIGEDETLAWNDDEDYLDTSSETEIGDTDPFTLSECGSMHGSNNQNCPKPGVNKIGKTDPFTEVVSEGEDFEEEFEEDEFDVEDDELEDFDAEDEFDAEDDETDVEDEFDAKDDKTDVEPKDNDLEKRLSAIEDAIAKISDKLGVNEFEDDDLYGDSEEDDDFDSDEEDEETEFELEVDGDKKSMSESRYWGDDEDDDEFEMDTNDYEICRMCPSISDDDIFDSMPEEDEEEFEDEIFIDDLDEDVDFEDDDDCDNPIFNKIPGTAKGMWGRFKHELGFGNHKDDYDFDLEDDEDDDEDNVFETRDYRRQMRESRLNTFGKHPAYRKKVMDLPTSRHQEFDGYYDMNDESVMSDAPFGQHIGDSAPFDENVDGAIEEAINRAFGRRKNL